MSRLEVLVAGILAAAFTFLLGAHWRHEADEATPLPDRQALASALFHQYGSIAIGRYRHRSFWLSDADEVLDYARRYPRG